jgi:hypothetical protein
MCRHYWRKRRLLVRFAPALNLRKKRKGHRIQRLIPSRWDVQQAWHSFRFSEIGYAEAMVEQFFPIGDP